MSPLKAISSWLETLELDMHLEVAAFATFLMFEHDEFLTLGGSGQLEALHRWLNEPDLTVDTAADRALFFKICFGCFVEDRMTDAGWRRTEELVRKILQEARRDGKFAAARKAQRMLEFLPARKGSWKRVVKSWTELAATHLTQEAVTNWAEKRKSLRVISRSGVPIVAVRSSHRGTG
ncbi:MULTISPECIES: hypothetical protein [Bradyrhizobium]|uniref:hypothetical protein n=1 Tax=Bradyrhizobium TaxID=374 RepID=UPI00155F51E6|nr:MULTISPECIES: hypothetical protein [Bradyrhizobium]MDD1522445.1 hypothetical protein [Bradyrhizobium sp. WBAH30]MDD1546369.1 hypothetical protein [Bradyrhizobium sp. WBAH41]MDD1560972.1 hypothetical protein [Bradyrhizobium sp. WBAH23]MDD1567376.1 hypothetical protein [Bradyrhizobium sp. WBAH33]MDD1594038.1 hypothetical protein [Bradyrhizobium sp. WBAH42]